MARIRYLKPGFFKDEDLSEFPFEIRLLFEGLWNIADREGRLEDRPKRIKVEVFPYDNVDIEKGLVALSKAKKISKRPFILRYVGEDGMPYIQILEWHKHQKPHHTEKPSVIPSPTKEQLNNGCITVKEQEGMGMGNGEGNGDGEQASPALKAALNKVYGQGLNIFALINRLKKESKVGAKIPEEVLMRVCDSFGDNGSTVKDQWPWFSRAIVAEWEKWNAAKNVREGREWKKPPAQSIKEILGVQ